MEDFLNFEMKKMSVKANENPDLIWTVDIEDENGAKITVSWIQLKYIVDKLDRYISNPA